MRAKKLNIEGNYTGPYSEDWDIIYFPWQIREPNPEIVDTCHYYYHYPEQTPVLSQTFDIYVNGIDSTYAVGVIEMYDDRAKNCYNNTIQFSDDFEFRLFDITENNSVLADTTYILDTKTVDFTQLSSGKLMFKFRLKNLTLHHYYSLMLTTSYYVKTTMVVPFDMNVTTMSHFIIQDEPYLCSNNNESGKFCY